jgi:hypothetical protein
VSSNALQNTSLCAPDVQITAPPESALQIEGWLWVMHIVVKTIRTKDIAGILLVVKTIRIKDIVGIHLVVKTIRTKDIMGILPVVKTINTKDTVGMFCVELLLDFLYSIFQNFSRYSFAMVSYRNTFRLVEMLHSV